ncbi:MAG TPA: nucleotidyltransferase domain-containing protein [Candidatus Nanoarchaeia archaeon]|nr:nucleotidyltransferase domain-containing protein [Candidatus Nanoarchaeia archaeon]
MGKKQDRNSKENKTQAPTAPIAPMAQSNPMMNIPQMPHMTMSNMPHMPMPVQKPTAPQIDVEKLKSNLEGFKKAVVKKYSFTIALSIAPPSALGLFEEEDNIPKEVAQTNPIILTMVIPEEEYKNIPKIKPEVVKLAKETGENVWIVIRTPVDLWNYGLDSRFEMLDAVSASLPLYDKGFLGALRVANIHKSLVLRKFDKYVASYVIAGSLVRGTADKDSDVDVFVVIDDTDVKRMNRIDLLEKLRGMILDYIREANALAGVTNILNVQVYLLTDFWQSVKDAHPVHFTFIRDGIPLYDRGTFIPWKLLLKMGKIKPSPEAIELYMKQGEQTDDFVKRRLLDAMVDIYWGVVTPTQALMMLAGEAPPVPKVIVAEVKKVLVEQEKVMSADLLKILDKTVSLYKDYEHGKLKSFPGKEVDELLGQAKKYNIALKEIQKKLEKKMSEKSAEEIYGNVFTLLKTFFGNQSQSQLMTSFQTKMIKKGKIQPRFAGVLKELLAMKNKVKSGKLSPKEVDRVKRDALELIQALVEYGQRADLIKGEKTNLQITYSGNRKAELVILGDVNYIIENQSIREITERELKTTTKEAFEKALTEQKGKLQTTISAKLFETLKKHLGEFELSF